MRPGARSVRFIAGVCLPLAIVAGVACGGSSAESSDASGTIATGGGPGGSTSSTGGSASLGSGGSANTGGVAGTAGGSAGETGGGGTGGGSAGGSSGSAGGGAAGRPAGGAGGLAGAGGVGGLGGGAGGRAAPGGTGGSTGNATFVGLHGQLSVHGNKIVDQHGVPVTLHGMSLYAWNSKGLGFYNASAIDHLVHDWGANVIRIPIVPASVSSQTALLRTVVDACIRDGVYAIIDWHSEGGANAAAAAKFFASMATAYGNTPNVMYEPWNEPVTETWATIKAYHETVIRAIRPIDPDNIIICGNPRWDQHPEQAAADPITITTNVAYTFHFYAASHSVASFGGNVTGTLNKGFPVFVTEYGTCQASGGGAFDPSETQKWWTLLDANGIGSANWAVETNGETAAAFVPGANMTGPWSNTDLTRSGLLVENYIQSQAR